MNKNKRGGARIGTGPKPKYGEATTTLSFRVPISKAIEIEANVKRMIKQFELNISNNEI